MNAKFEKQLSLFLPLHAFSLSMIARGQFMFIAIRLSLDIDRDGDEMSPGLIIMEIFHGTETQESVADSAIPVNTEWERGR